MPVQELTRFLTELEQYRFLNPEQLRQTHALGESVGQDARQLAAELIRRGWLTPFQVNHILQGHAEKLVLGPYLLLERLGQGGMGQVYKARHVLMDRLVALKVLRPDLLLDHPSALERFRREIQAAAKLTHPNVVLAHDASEVGETFFLVMEYVAGDDLGRLLKQHGRLPPGEAAGYVRQAALGLQHAHEHGLVHRDIKPSNLIRANEGRVVKILDLGLARLQGRNEALAGALTHEGSVMGTPDYIAPEQATDSRSADIRADIYSLGCTLYHLLTGQPPFPGGSIPEKLLKHQQATPTPVEQLSPEVPPGLTVVVRRMMAKRPQDRYQTPREIADALIPFISADSIPVAAVYEAPSAPDTPTVDYAAPPTHNGAPSAAAKRSWPHRKRDRVLIAAALTAGLLAIVLPFLPKFGGRPARPVEKEQPDMLLSDGKDKRPDPPAKGGSGEPNGARVAEPKQLPPLPADAPARMVHLLRGHTGNVRCFAFSPDGKLLASGGDDNQALLWDVPSGEQHGPPLRHKFPVRALAWTSDGKTLASGSWGEAYNAAIKLWDPATGQERQTLPWENKTGTPSKAEVRGVAFSPSGKLLASGGGPLRIWDLGKEDGKPSVREWQQTLPSYLYGVAFSPDGKVVAAGCHERGDSVRVWSVDEAGDPSVLRGNERAFGLAHSDVFGVVAFVAEGKLLVRVTSNGRGAGKSTASVKVWAVDAQRRRYTLRDTYEIPGGGVFALASAADGQLRVAVAEGPPAFGGFPGFGKEPSRTEVKLWDGATQKVMSFETGHKNSITSLAFSPDGSRLVTGSEDQTARLWELTR
jgi:serine/threonine protein kinase